MKQGSSNPGFTVIEVMIVVVVMGVLIISAMTLLSGKQAAVEFNQSANDIQAQVNQVINSVQTGYYVKPANFTCTPNNGVGPPNQQPIVTVPVGGVDTTGTNNGCIFIGKAIQFGVHGTNMSGYNIYSLVGRQYDANTGDVVSTLPAADPIAMFDSSKPADYLAEKNTLLFGTKVYGNMNYQVSVGGPYNKTGIVAFVTNLSQVQLGGSSTASLYAIDTSSGSDYNQSANTAVVNQINYASAVTGAVYFTPASSVNICLYGGTDKVGILTIGNNNRQLISKLRIDNKGSSLPTECL
jgi:prepilin-type N-terminal cleavage/methylation domain-containing protein